MKKIIIGVVILGVFFLFFAQIIYATERPNTAPLSQEEKDAIDTIRKTYSFIHAPYQAVRFVMDIDEEGRTKHIEQSKAKLKNRYSLRLKVKNNIRAQVRARIFKRYLKEGNQEKKALYRHFLNGFEKLIEGRLGFNVFKALERMEEDSEIFLQMFNNGPTKIV